MPNGRPQHFLRLGVHAEQHFFEENKDKYDVVVLGANLVCFFSSATATLMANKLKDKKFIIDPITHAFGHDPRYIMTPGAEGEERKVKSSLASLADAYGPPISTAICQPKPRPVTRNDFASPKAVADLAGKVIDFQQNYLINAIDPEDRKYMEGDLTDLLKPLFLVAPYFYMKSTTIDEWLSTNLDFVAAAKNAAGAAEVYAEIVIDRGILERDLEVDKIAQAYQNLASCDGYLLWISDLSEHEASLSALRGLRRLVKLLSDTHRPVVNLFGGYFSLLLWNFGLSGVCHGPGYGEDRDVIPVGGGMPVSKYYLTPVHQRLKFRDVALMIQGGAWKSVAEFYKEVCAGATCKKVLGNDLRNFDIFGREAMKESKGKTYTFPTTEARFLSTEHYLEAKAFEFEEVSKKGLPELVDQLKAANKKYDPWMPGAQLRYLDNWVEALKD